MNDLLTNPLLGGFFLILLFACCFLLVHIFLLVKIGWEHQTGERKKNPTLENEKQPEKPTEKPEKKPPQPVYYIVERKKKKPKNYYTEPKEFRFK